MVGQPELKIPPGLSLRHIRRAENIPDAYIKKYFILNEHRARHVKLDEEYSLLETLIERLGAVNGVNVTHLQPVCDPDTDEDNYDEVRQRIMELDNGVDINIETLKEALTQISSSTALFSIFSKAKIRRKSFGYEDDYDDNINECPYSSDILLYKEEVTFDTDQQVIAKLKTKVFAEIRRYRRAKENTQRRHNNNQFRIR